MARVRWMMTCTVVAVLFASTSDAKGMKIRIPIPRISSQGGGNDSDNSTKIILGVVLFLLSLCVWLCKLCCREEDSKQVDKPMSDAERSLMGESPAGDWKENCGQETTRIGILEHTGTPIPLPYTPLRPNVHTSPPTPPTTTPIPIGWTPHRPDVHSSTPTKPTTASIPPGGASRRLNSNSLNSSSTPHSLYTPAIPLSSTPLNASSDAPPSYYTLHTPTPVSQPPTSPPPSFAEAMSLYEDPSSSGSTMPPLSYNSPFPTLLNHPNFPLQPPSSIPLPLDPRRPDGIHYVQAFVH